MKPKLTPWYPASVKPVRKGVYRTDADLMYDGLTHCFQRWSGRYWCQYHCFAEGAGANVAKSRCQNVRWRGLTYLGAQP